MTDVPTGQKKAESSKAEPGPSRRALLAPLAGGAVAAGTLPMFAGAAAAQGQPAGIPSIQIPKEIPASLADAPKKLSFEGRGMTGAEVFADLCRKENLAALFCAPGNYTIIHAIAAAG